MYSGSAAQAASTDFLLCSLDSSKWWRDWDTQGGISDEWVTAYTACALANGAESPGRTAAERALDVLCLRRPSKDGWSYNSHVPPDADSTTWVCRLARALNRAAEVAPALLFLRRCLQADGGLATYASDERVRRAMHLPPDVSFRGWLSSHSCVTAAAAALPEFSAMPEVVAYLRRVQQPEGHWNGYWWPDPEYATALAVEALRVNGATDGDAAVQAAERWARARPHCNSAFVLACRVRILRHADPQASLDLASALDRLQNDDGSWPSSARIRIPPPDVVQPASVWNWSYDRKDVFGLRLDQARIFTTATVLNALQLLP